MLTSCDPAQLPEASTVDDPSMHMTPGYCHNCGHGGDATCPHCRSTHFEAEKSSPDISHALNPVKVAELARFIAGKRNGKFWWGCFLIATGDLQADGVSMTEFAERWGITRACVSKTCVEITERLGILPSRYMRTEAARESYQQSNIRKVKT